jgi:hypothetical protein
VLPHLIGVQADALALRWKAKTWPHRLVPQR